MSSVGMVHEQYAKLRAADGAECDATWFSVGPKETKAVVVCTSAMGVRASHYRQLARELAKRGLSVLVYDLRGIGSSSVVARRGVDFGYHELINLDLQAAIATARERHLGLPLILLGHSIGGHISAMYASVQPQGINGLVLIATGTSHIANWPTPYRVGILTMVQLTRIATALLGYFPGRYFGFFGNEANTLMREWRTLTLGGEFRVAHSSFNFEARLRELELPVLTMSFPGDVFAPPAAVKHFNRKIPKARVSYQYVEPWELGIDRLDHFRWAKNPVRIADLVSQWLNRELGISRLEVSQHEQSDRRIR